MHIDLKLVLAVSTLPQRCVRILVFGTPDTALSEYWDDARVVEHDHCNLPNNLNDGRLLEIPVVYSFWLM